MKKAARILEVLAWVIFGLSLLFWVALRLGSSACVAKVAKAQGDIQTFSVALVSYESVTGQLPTEEQGLNALVEKPSVEPVLRRWQMSMESVPLDPWGEPYGYVRKGPKYGIYSKGPDRLTHTRGNDPDDINSWRGGSERFDSPWVEAKAPFRIDIEPRHVPFIGFGLSAVLFACARRLRWRASLVQGSSSATSAATLAN